MNISLEDMMNLMMNGRKESFYISIILYIIILIILILIAFLTDRFIFKTNNLKIFKICLIVFLLSFIFVLGRSWYIYKHGMPNQSPWSVGIYEAYYECSKCNSLAGGIFGKGPTERLTLDKKCIHDWQAVYKEDFKTKIVERKSPKNE